MVRLRKGMTIIGPNNKRGVVTGWGAGNVYASLAGGILCMAAVVVVDG